jgi:hypothetical protein
LAQKKFWKIDNRFVKNIFEFSPYSKNQKQQAFYKCMFTRSVDFRGFHDMPLAEVLAAE